MTSVFYPGSFDPPTRGHEDLVRRARGIFDRVVVAVGVNVHKSGLLTLEERMEVLRETFADLDGIEVLSFSGLAVNAAREAGCGAVLRGLRNETDFAYEFPMALTNRELAPQMETLFLMPSHEYSFLSSSLVKEVHHHGGQVDRFLPAPVARLLQEKRS